MSHKKAKRIRKLLRKANRTITPIPYAEYGRTIVASPGRRGYQKLKTMEI